MRMRVRRIVPVGAVLALVACASAPVSEVHRASSRNPVRPQYPRLLAEAKVQGCVTISFIVDSKGLADKFIVHDSQPPGAFDAAAINAAARADWKPQDPPLRGPYAFQFEIPGAGPPPQCAPLPDEETLNPNGVPLQ